MIEPRLVERRPKSQQESRQEGEGYPWKEGLRSAKELQETSLGALIAGGKYRKSHRAVNYDLFREHFALSKITYGGPPMWITSASRELPGEFIIVFYISLQVYLGSHPMILGCCPMLWTQVLEAERKSRSSGAIEIMSVMAPRGPRTHSAWAPQGKCAAIRVKKKFAENTYYLSRANSLW